MRIFCFISSLLALAVSGICVCGCQSRPPSSGASPLQSAQPPRLSQIQPALSNLEQCNNAWDDNENGLIDEGCGVKQAQIQVLVAWDDGETDLDLLVSDPQGEIATATAPTASGLAVLRDCPSDDECGDQPYEMVSLEEDEYLAGRYHVRVLARQLAQAGRPLVARLGLRTPQYTRAYRLEFFNDTQLIDLDFVVAAATQSE